MLDKIKAALTAKTAAPELSQDVEAQLSLAANVAATAEAKVLEMSTQLEASLSNVASLTSQLAEAKSSLEKYAELAAQAEAAQAEMIAKAAAAKNEARMSQLSHVVGDVKAEALFKSFGNADDASFAMLIETAQVALSKESDGEMFKEVGVEGAEASVSPEDVNKAAFSQAIKNRKNKGTK